MAETLPRFLHCLYAEDVRLEASGQYSVIGVFPGAAIDVSSADKVMPKVAVVATLSVPFSEFPVDAQVRFELLWKEQVIQQRVAPAPPMQEAREKDPTGNAIAQFVNVVSPLQVGEGGVMQAVAYVNDLRIPGMPLRINPVEGAPVETS